MTRYILRRLIHSVFIIWGCATLVFFLVRMIPGDPVVQMLGPEYTPEAAAALRRKMVVDYAASVVAFVGVSMPSFWFGIILILVFAVRLQWLPAIGYAEIGE